MDRVIFDDDGTLNDISVNASKFLSGTDVIPVVGADDALYLGSFLPFNHRWFELSVLNDAACSINTIEFWDGNEWKEAVEIIDETAVSGETMAQSGLITWVPDRDETWMRDDTVDNSEIITGLGTVTIYDLYWAKLSFTGDMNVLTAIKYIGYKFANDDDLAAEYPELGLSTVMTQFETGKTSWDDQHFLSAERIINDLISRGVVLNKNQILNPHLFKEASIHKAAEIIYKAFGDDYEDDRKKALGYYNKAFNKKVFEIDQQSNAILDVSERFSRAGFLKR